MSNKQLSEEDLFQQKIKNFDKYANEVLGFTPQKIVVNEQQQKTNVDGKAEIVKQIIKTEFEFQCNRFGKYIPDKRIERYMNLIALYIARDKRFENYFYLSKNGENKNRFNLNNSLFITGSNGRGKSLVMEIVQDKWKQITFEIGFNGFSPNKFCVVEDAKDIAETIRNKGYDGCYEIAKNTKFNIPIKDSNYNIIYLNDKAHEDLLVEELGMEPDLVLTMGTRTNAMTAFLHYREKLLKKHDIKTHIISNLHPSEIVGRYGKAIQSRLFNYNIIDLGFDEQLDMRRINNQF